MAVCPSGSKDGPAPRAAVGGGAPGIPWTGFAGAARTGAGAAASGFGEVIMDPQPGQGPEAPASSIGTVRGIPQAWQVK